MDAVWLAQGGASTIWAGLDGLDWTGIWTGLDWLPDNCEADGGLGCQSAGNLDWTGLDWNHVWTLDSGGGDWSFKLWDPGGERRKVSAAGVRAD